VQQLKNLRRRGNANPRCRFCLPHHLHQQEIFMRSRLAISTLVITSLLGATTLASAQMQPAPGASSEDNATPGATKMKTGKVKSSKMKSGTTTGMSSGAKKSGARTPAGKGADDDGGAK
jgi:hypothetical protein